MIIKIISAFALLPMSMAIAMQPLDEFQLSEITGEGIGATFDNVVINSREFGQDNAFQIRLRLSESSSADEVILSGLQFYRSGAAPDINGGGRFGTYDDPFVVAELREINETHKYTRNGQQTSRTHTALYTGFPAADLGPLNRNFFTWARSEGRSTTYTSEMLRNMTYSVSTYRGLPNNFFTSGSVSLGNFFQQSDQYLAQLQAHEEHLDRATDKFDLSFRVDLKTAVNANLDPMNPQNNDPWLFGRVDLEGVRLYGTYAMLWAHSNQGETISNASAYLNNSAPTVADRGLAMSIAMGLRADAIRLSTDTAGGAAGEIEFQHVDMYLPLGTADQPMTISTVQFQQTQRGTWKNPVLMPSKTQLRLEIAALPQDVKQAPKGNIFVQSVQWGGGPDQNGDYPSDIITGKEDIYLRDSNGNVIKTVNDVVHRAFVPKTVIYNEQIAAHNQQNPDNPLPFIPNQNVMEIRGIEIQRLVITTQDL